MARSQSQNGAKDLLIKVILLVCTLLMSINVAIVGYVCIRVDNLSEREAAIEAVIPLILKHMDDSQKHR